MYSIQSFPGLGDDYSATCFAEHGIPTEGEAGGLSVKLVCKPGKGVIARLGRNKDRFELVISRCTVFEPPKDKLEERKLESGIPFWPHAFANVHCDFEKLLQDWNNEYAVLCYEIDP